MASTAASLEHARTYREQLLANRTAMTQLLRDTWPELGTNGYAEELARWGRYATSVVTAYQGRSAQAAASYLHAVSLAELGPQASVPAVDSSRYATGNTEGGTPLTQALTLDPARLAAAAQATGRSAAEATRMGFAQATRTAHSELVNAADQALGDLMTADRRVRGWRRVLTDNPCGACIAEADGRIHPAGQRMRRHPHDRCVQEIVFAGVADTFRPMTGQQLFDELSRAQQDALFANRGGAAKAELIRSGQVPLHALITRAPRGPNRPDVISETPLKALV